MRYFVKIYKKELAGEKTMKNLFRTLVIAIIFIFSVTISYSQQVIATADSTAAVKKKTGTEQGVRDQNQTRNQGEVKGQDKGLNAGNAKSVKKVNSAKPDWSKAKGARPNIVRPSGSGVPRGAGKPGGVGRFKGR